LRPRRLVLPRGRSLDLDGHAVVMGIINATPDSFYAGSRVSDVNAAIDTAAAMIMAGAGIIDVGGEPTKSHHVLYPSLPRSAQGGT